MFNNLLVLFLLVFFFSMHIYTCKCVIMFLKLGSKRLLIFSHFLYNIILLRWSRKSASEICCAVSVLCSQKDFSSARSEDLGRAMYWCIDRFAHELHQDCLASSGEGKLEFANWPHRRSQCRFLCQRLVTWSHLSAAPVRLALFLMTLQ